MDGEESADFSFNTIGSYRFVSALRETLRSGRSPSVGDEKTATARKQQPTVHKAPTVKLIEVLQGFCKTMESLGKSTSTGLSECGQGAKLLGAMNVFELV